MCTSLSLTHEPYVKVTLVGDLIKMADGQLAVEVVNHSFDGTQEYRDQIPLVIDGESKCKVGDKVELFGTEAQFDGRTKVFAKTEHVKKVAKSTPYENVAEAVGRLAMKDTRQATADKRPWGWMLLEAGENFLARGVFFRNLVSFIERQVPEDAIVKITGALRNREYPTTNGGTDRMLEITALPRLNYKGQRVQDAGIRVLAMPQTVNPFMGYSPIAAPAAEAKPDKAKQSEIPL